jgi:hypothetical protein
MCARASDENTCPNGGGAGESIMLETCKACGAAHLKPREGTGVMGWSYRSAQRQAARSAVWKYWVPEMRSEWQAAGYSGSQDTSGMQACVGHPQAGVLFLDETHEIFVGAANGR